MKSKILSIKGLSDRAALELLCNEINILRGELETALSHLDGETVVMPDGLTLTEFLKKNENR